MLKSPGHRRIREGKKCRKVYGLGMIPHKKSLIKFFGHKPKIKNIMKKFQRLLDFWFIFEIVYFEGKIMYTKTTY